MLERQSALQPTVLPQAAAQPGSPSAAGVQPGWLADSLTSQGVGGGIAFSIDNSHAISWDYILGNPAGSWQNIRLREQSDAGVIWASGPDDIYAVGDWGVILHFSGIHWSARSSGTYAHLYGVWGLPGG